MIHINLRKILAFITITTTGAFLLTTDNNFVSANINENKDKLLYHSYTSYDALDSKIYLYDRASSKIRDIDSGDFMNAMNADFGSNMYDIIFMAIDLKYDEWDIYRYNSFTDKYTNLTENSGYRNEDPKFSPDGNKIVFKRGYWSSEQNDFVYNLAEMDLRTNEIIYLTDDISENSMPYYSADGSKVYYALSEKDKTSICELNKKTMNTEVVFTEENVHVYYPVCSENRLFFTKWFSEYNHNDCIVELKDRQAFKLPFNNETYNCSDPFSTDEGSLYYSSTERGNYDIFFYNGVESNLLDETVTDLNELGASCYTLNNGKNIAKKTADYLLCRDVPEDNMDADSDGEITIYDMILMRKQLE